MEHFSHPMDLPVSEMHMNMVGQVSNSPESQHFYSPMPIPSNTVFNTSMLSNNGVGHYESQGCGIGPSPIYITDHLGGKDASLMNNTAHVITSLPVKRKPEVGPLVNNSISPQSLLPNKRPAHMGSDVSSARFLQPYAPQRKTAPAQSRLDSPGILLQNSQNKKSARNDSTPCKSGSQRGHPARRQTAQAESASKARPESTEAVRSKMRQSLAGALALAVQKQDNVLNVEKSQSEVAITNHIMDSQTSADNSKDCSAFSTTNECQVLPAELRLDGRSGNVGEAFQGFQYSSILPDEDVTFGDNFFAKDDLLQGNGLSWAFDFDAQMGEEGKEAQHDEKLKPMKEEVKVVPVLTPDNLAFEIEAELYKLFGGVNKKYREKARSLLFNLKDRNNPDLRVSVMSGEISPEKLCSMSAEELASKELSQWRMAKAEEFAQMVVLPDTEVDVRRLVKKTHKGEYQVEMDHNDDDIAAEVSSGTSMLTQAQPKKVTALQSLSKASPKDTERVAGQGNMPEDPDFSGSLIIPTDGTDLMQGMIVDELKDPESLPPIVSLDEFMESLNNEPPFEDLSGDAGLKTPTPQGESSKPVRNSQGEFTRVSNSPKDVSSKKAGVFNKHDGTEKSSVIPAKPKYLPSSIKPKDEYIWNGTLQLHISSSVIVRGLFQSGEKTSTKEWPTSLEIKGRVRLDAFEKFLQELPMSRTRAVMVLQYVLKDTSSEKQRANLSEAIDSYITDERLGYAEPVPGVELYICPGTPRIADTLKKLVPKEKTETNSTTAAVENGLIGVVVWRRAHNSHSTISPNSTSHTKHASKKQPIAPPHRAHKSPNVNASNNKTPTRTPPPGSNNNRPEPQKEEDDDIPPGFGPGAVARKDDDDLPEFNFSGDLAPLNQPSTISGVGVKMTQRPIEQVRELIKKYGQSGTSVNSTGRVDNNANISGIEPWEDDDDIPEWRPQGLQPPPYAVARGQAPLLTSNQHGVPMVNPQQPQGGARHPDPGSRWVQQPGPRWRQY